MYNLQRAHPTKGSDTPRGNSYKQSTYQKKQYKKLIDSE